jgi:hypothetical protein
MSFKPLVSISELRREEEKLAGKGSYDDDEELFYQAFRHGCYHHEAFDFLPLTHHLTNAQLASLFLPIARELIQTRTEVEKVMRLYSALADWIYGDVVEKKRVQDALDSVREIMVKEPMWGDGLAFFKLIDFGVRYRLGSEHFLELRKKYDRALHQAYEEFQKKK